MVVHFTAPCRNGTCDSLDLGPLDDLAYLHFLTGDPPRTVLTVYAPGLECAELWQVVEGLTPGDSLWIEAEDFLSNRSCASNKVAVVDRPPITGDVPGLAFRERVVQWYDVSGRRIERPVRAGIYFRRVAGEKSGRVVVVR